MRLIDADALYEYIDDVKYICDTYAEVEDILDIIKKQPTINQTKISPNLTNKGFIKKAFPNIDLDLNQKHNGYFLGYRDKTELRPIVWFDENWLKEKYNGQCQDVKTKKCKWILYDHATLMPKDHENIPNPYWRIPTRYKVELKYCPYCGREIDYSEVDTEIEKRKNKNA